jgi:hypothetical protein
MSLDPNTFDVALSVYGDHPMPFHGERQPAVL